MTVSIHGIISHRKLMELKNCGVVEPDFFEREVNKYFDMYRMVIAETLHRENSGFIAGLFYTKQTAKKDSEWMFPDRRDLLEHLIYLDGQSKYVSLSKEELNYFTLLHQAAIGSERAQQVLLCFKYSDQVLVDDDTGFHVDWLLRNATILKQMMAKIRGED